MKSKKYVIYAEKKKRREKQENAAHSECNLRYKVPKEMSVVFHNGSTYDYHFIIKQLAKEFEGEFECF